MCIRDRLCIVKPDGTVAEIMLRNHQPSFEVLNNEQLFFENYQYKFILREVEEYENVEIFVGDYSVPIHYNASMDCYETDQDLVFGNCFDLTYISAVSYTHLRNIEKYTAERKRRYCSCFHCSSHCDCLPCIFLKDKTWSGNQGNRK